MWSVCDLFHDAVRMSYHIASKNGLIGEKLGGKITLIYIYINKETG
jgi:hypothetical protein